MFHASGLGFVILGRAPEAVLPHRIGFARISDELEEAVLLLEVAAARLARVSDATLNRRVREVLT